MGTTPLTNLPGEGVLRDCGSLRGSIVTAPVDIVYSHRKWNGVPCSRFGVRLHMIWVIFIVWRNWDG